MPLTVTPVGNGVFRVGDQPPRTAWAAAVGSARWVFIDGQVFVIDTTEGSGRRRARSHGGPLAAPMPATVRKVNVVPGDTVKAGDVLIVLEAMKMELPVRASAAGVVTALYCEEGQLVQPGVTLVSLEDQ